MARPAAKPRKKRNVVAKVVEPKVKKTIVPIHEDDWEEKPKKYRRTNKFCVDCLDVEGCMKEKLAMVIHCIDRRTQ